MTKIGHAPCPPADSLRARAQGEAPTKQESVWDYPRPPRVEATPQLVQVCFNGVLIAESARAMRVLEMSHPPVYYVPPEDVWRPHLLPNLRTTFCEYKGVASYFDVVVGDRAAMAAAWCYPAPTKPFESIRGFLAFYPAAMEACFVDGELVVPQPGDFYGGWITRSVKGPFKGMSGMSHHS